MTLPEKYIFSEIQTAAEKAAEEIIEIAVLSESVLVPRVVDRGITISKKQKYTFIYFWFQGTSPIYINIFWEHNL